MAVMIHSGICVTLVLIRCKSNTLYVINTPLKYFLFNTAQFSILWLYFAQLKALKILPT